MDYKKRRVTLDGRRETMYIFAAPLGLLSDVFAVDVRTQGDAIRTETRFARPSVRCWIMSTTRLFTAERRTSFPCTAMSH